MFFNILCSIYFFMIYNHRIQPDLIRTPLQSEKQRCMIWAHMRSDKHQMRQVWDFSRSVFSTFYGSLSQNALKSDMKKSQIYQNCGQYVPL